MEVWIKTPLGCGTPLKKPRVLVGATGHGIRLSFPLWGKEQHLRLCPE